MLESPLGSSATIADAAALRASIVPDIAGEYRLQLAVTNASGQVHTRTLKLSTDNSAPRADAGPDRSVEIGTPLLFDAFASTDVDGDELLASWHVLAKPAGSVAQLIPVASSRQQFTPDLAGIYVVQKFVPAGRRNRTHQGDPFVCRQSVFAEENFHQAGFVVRANGFNQSRGIFLRLPPAEYSKYQLPQSVCPGSMFRPPMGLANIVSH